MSFMDNILSNDKKKKKRNISYLIDSDKNELPIINNVSDMKSIIKNLKTMNNNNKNVIQIKFDENSKKLKHYMKKTNKKVKFLSKTNCTLNNLQPYNIRTNTNENTSNNNTSSIQYNNITDFMSNIKQKAIDNMISFKKKNDFKNNTIKKKNYKKKFSNHFTNEDENKNKRKLSIISNESNLSMIDSGNEIISNNIFYNDNDNYDNDNINNEKLDMRFISYKQQKKRMSKNFYRQMTKSPIKKINKNIGNLSDYKKSFFKSKQYFIENNKLIIDIDEYLINEREKIGNTISNIQEDYLKKVKQNFLDKSLLFIKKKKEIKEKLVKVEEVNFKEIINNIYKSLFIKLISSKNFQRIELSLLKYFDSIENKFYEKSIINYILDTFLDIYYQTMNYIFNGDNKNKFPILENNSSNEMVKLLKEIYLKNIVYINTIITRDFNKENFVKYSEIVRDVFIVVKRKKKTISSGFLKKMNGINKKKERRLSLLSILKDNDKISLYELELNKFQKTSNFLIEWNPLLNKHMLDSRAEIKKKQDMFDIFKTYNISSKINLKNDIELLKSLGGNPMSKESAIIRFKELKEKSIKNNKYYFRKLYELINKGQNVLFFEEFNKLINDIDINYIYRRTDYTLLMNAVKNENESIIEFLIKKGCDINIQNHFGNTALHIAFMINNFQVINLLINYNANQNILNNQGLNPWECWKNYYY